MQVNLDRIPAKYILRRYTRDAKKDVPFNRMDRKLRGKDGDTYRERHNRLITIAMKLIGRAIMSSAGTDKAEDAMKSAYHIVSKAQPDIDCYGGGNEEHAQVAGSGKKGYMVYLPPVI